MNNPIFKLEIDSANNEFGLDERLIALFNKSLTEIETAANSGIMQLYFVSDEEIKKINKKYRGKNKMTDVISLSYIDAHRFPNDNLLGEIFISFDTAKKYSEERGILMEKEIEFLFIHGVLHVFGFEHSSSEKEAAMFSMQDKIFGSDEWRVIL